jgi:hypothetical protein
MIIRPAKWDGFHKQVILICKKVTWVAWKLSLCLYDELTSLCQCLLCSVQILRPYGVSANHSDMRVATLPVG